MPQYIGYMPTGTANSSVTTSSLVDRKYNSGIWSMNSIFTKILASNWPNANRGLPTVTVKMWGAGGGRANGGGGTWLECTLEAVPPGTGLTIKVGQAGSTTPSVSPFPNGGTSDRADYGSGGGLTGLFYTTGLVPIAIAGAGAGGNTFLPGGAGGDQTSSGAGSTSGVNATAGTGGTNVAGGTGGTGTTVSGANGAAQSGGDGSSGGGDGYYGGGGGSFSVGDGTGTGGGGSSYVIPAAVSVTVTPGSGSTTGNSSDTDFPGSVGGAGENGYLVLVIGGVKTTYSYTGSAVTVTV